MMNGNGNDNGQRDKEIDACVCDMFVKMKKCMCQNVNACQCKTKKNFCCMRCKIDGDNEKAGERKNEMSIYSNTYKYDIMKNRQSLPKKKKYNQKIPYRERLTHSPKKWWNNYRKNAKFKNEKCDGWTTIRNVRKTKSFRKPKSLKHQYRTGGEIKTKNRFHVLASLCENDQTGNDTQLPNDTITSVINNPLKWKADRQPPVSVSVMVTKQTGNSNPPPDGTTISESNNPPVSVSVMVTKQTGNSNPPPDGTTISVSNNPPEMKADRQPPVSVSVMGTNQSGNNNPPPEGTTINKHTGIDAPSLRKSDDKINSIGTWPKLKIGHVNARSARNKSLLLYEQIVTNDLDIFFVSESWLIDGNVDDDKIVGDIKPTGFDYTCINRNCRQGGSIGCFFRSNLRFKQEPSPKINLNDTPKNIKTMEIMDSTLTVQGKRMKFICIYRPESSTVKPYKKSEFYDEFAELMAHYNLSNDEIFIFGDLNFHVNKPQKEDVVKFMDILDTNNLHQHINEPTHEHGNTLDLLITRQSSTMVHNVEVGERISDHDCIMWDINYRKPEKPQKTVKFRKTKQINIGGFKNDIKASLEALNDYNDPGALVNEYNEALQRTLDRHAPEITKEIIIRESTPWITDDYILEKRKRRKLEKKMKKTQLEIDKQAYKDQKNKTNELLNENKGKFFKKLIDENKDNPRNLFKVMNSALNRKRDTPFPPHTSETDLANDFSDFFTDKISKIRDKLDNEPHAINISDIQEIGKFTTTFKEFQLLSEDEVRILVQKSPTKHCELDPMPTWLVKDCLEEILPTLTRIINLSLQLGDMPLSLKHAIIKPLLKKMGLELIDKNYRPVSNLTYLSKLIERAVVYQLFDHLKVNKLMDIYQSAYRMFHSTETALLKVRNDILMEMDKRNTVMLVLLDLSAAFDTIDHNILLNRLEKRCGITGTALKWFASYLADRTQSVSVNCSHSGKQPLKYGVPQGSVLGPILFTIYTSALSDILAEDELNYHCFADDTQLYLGFSPIAPNGQQDALNKMNLSLAKIKTFMSENRLKLNDDKTEFILIGSKYWLDKLNFDSIKMGNTTIKAVDKARNLGIIFDKEMGLDAQIKNVCKKGYGNLKNVSSIRRSLDENSAKIAVHAFVTSHLDYGNSLYYGLYKYQIDKLQLLQNSAARVVKLKRKFDHISEDLEKMHWLPVAVRIEFKILLLTWKSLHGQGPEYLQNLLKINNKNELRPPYKLSLLVPKTNQVTCGDRAFEVVAPILWNSLPDNIRLADKLSSFKSKLKTYFFRKCYPNATNS